MFWKKKKKKKEWVSAAEYKYLYLIGYDLTPGTSYHYLGIGQPASIKLTFKGDPKTVNVLANLAVRLMEKGELLENFKVEEKSEK